jgi:hypothetical protein
MSIEVDRGAVDDLLRGWLARDLDPDALGWLDEQRARLSEGGGERAFNIAFGMVPRRIGKQDLSLAEADFEAASALRDGWRPVGMSADQAARLVLLLEQAGDAEAFTERLERLFRSADVGELVTLYRGLPLYPGQPRYAARAAEGVRTNMRAVFEAVAHHNPYPAEQFDDGAWNQLVLKALFVGSALAPVVGLDRRANAALARMLCDYAHERWAASRPVSPELWRCVGPHADDAGIGDLERVLREGTTVEREGAALALAASSHPRAGEVLAQAPSLRRRIERGALAWPAS